MCVHVCVSVFCVMLRTSAMSMKTRETVYAAKSRKTGGDYYATSLHSGLGPGHHARKGFFIL